MKSYKKQYRVYFKDTDAGGIMYHARYVELMEMSRTDFFHYKGYSIREFLDKKRIVFPVYNLSVRYRSSAYLDDILTVELAVDTIKGAKIFFSYKIYNQKQELLTEASTVNVVLDLSKQKPLRVKEVFPEWMSQLE